jgi:hypothetical protein
MKVNSPLQEVGAKLRKDILVLCTLLLYHASGYRYYAALQLDFAEAQRFFHHRKHGKTRIISR